MSRSPTLEAMKQDTRPGRCIACDEPLPKSKTKPAIVHQSLECLSAYHSAYGIDRRAGRLTKPNPLET